MIRLSDGTAADLLYIVLIELADIYLNSHVLADVYHMYHAPKVQSSLSCIGILSRLEVLIRTFINISKHRYPLGKFPEKPEFFFKKKSER
jgi:hypothetical protein